jgi:conjugal transfer pilus assembly protein TraL
MKQVEIPRYIDDPLHFMLWQADEIAPIGIGLFIGFYAGSPLLFAAIGAVMVHYYKKLRDSKPDGFVLHYLYWHGFVPSRSKSIPNPFVKKYLP